jgi:DNA polymerase III subunit delta
MAYPKSKSKKADPLPNADMRVVVLCGPEDMLKRDLFGQLRDAINKVEGDEIEPIELDGRTAEPSRVFDELRTIGMFQNYRLVVVDSADEFVKKHRALVERYTQEPASGACLVLRSSNWNSPKLDKMVGKVGHKYKCEPLKGAEAASWLIKRAKSHHQCVLNRDAASALVDRLGVSLMRLDSELAKLVLLTGDEGAIDIETIDQVVGRGSDEQAWVVQEAVLKALSSRAPAGSVARQGKTKSGAAIETVHELIDLAGQPDVLVMYFLADLIRKLHLAAMMRAQRVPPGVIGKELKLWGERRTMFFDVLGGIKPSSTAKMLARVVKADARSKSGLGSVTRNLECFCAALADDMS